MDYHWDVLDVCEVGSSAKKLFWIFNDNGSHHALWRERLDVKNQEWEANSWEHGFRIEDFLSQHHETFSNFLALRTTELSCVHDGGGISIQIKLDMKKDGKKTIVLHNFNGEFDCNCKEVEELGRLLMRWNPANKKCRKQCRAI